MTHPRGLHRWPMSSRCVVACSPDTTWHGVIGQSARLLFPLTWAAILVAVWLWKGVWAAALIAPILPLTGYVALHFAERFDRVVGATRALAILLFRRRAFLRLTAERHDIRRQILD